MALVAAGQISYNGSFELVNRNNLPGVWFPPYISLPGAYEACMDTIVSFDGKQCLHIAPTEKCRPISTVLLWQELKLESIGPVKKLKIVEYVKAWKLDSADIIVGFNRHDNHKVYDNAIESMHMEDVYKGTALWHKLTYEADIDSAFKKTNIYNVFSGSFNGYIDKIEIFANDKKILDAPLNATALLKPGI